MQWLVPHCRPNVDIEAAKLTVEAILTGRVKVELQQLVVLA